MDKESASNWVLLYVIPIRWIFRWQVLASGPGGRSSMASSSLEESSYSGSLEYFWSAVIHKFCSYIKGLRLICHSMFSCSFCLNLGLKMFILRLFCETKHLNSIENYLASLVLLVPSSFSKTLCDFQTFSLHTFSLCFASPRKLTAEVGITFLMETQTISAWHQVALNEDVEPTQRRSEDCIVNSVALSFVLHMDEPLS